MSDQTLSIESNEIHLAMHRKRRAKNIQSLTVVRQTMFDPVLKKSTVFPVQPQWEEKEHIHSVIVAGSNVLSPKIVSFEKAPKQANTK